MLAPRMGHLTVLAQIGEALERIVGLRAPVAVDRPDLDGLFPTKQLHVSNCLAVVGPTIPAWRRGASAPGQRLSHDSKGLLTKPPVDRARLKALVPQDFPQQPGRSNPAVQRYRFHICTAGKELPLSCISLVDKERFRSFTRSYSAKRPESQCRNNAPVV